MYSKLIAYCSSKKGAVQDYPFGPEPLVMKVGEKMFALLNEEGQQDKANISLKCDPVIAENLREQHKCVLPGYHLNKKHWNTVVINGSLPLADLQAMIDHSYDLVFRSLTKNERESVTKNLRVQ